MSEVHTAQVLVEALPYIRRFAGRTVVVKYGGNALAGTSDHDALALFAEDIVLMHTVGIRPVVVHGGGPQINDMLARLNITSTFSQGLRVTDAETMQVVQMVLNGQVNPQIVSAINTHGNVAVGVSGIDGRTLQVTARNKELGFVGDIDKVRPHVIQGLLDDGFVPVLSTIGVDKDGQSFNINADTAAGAVAEALGAEKIIYLTDIAGLRRDIDDASSLIQRTTVSELQELISTGVISGGMIPKVDSCIQAVRGGVKSAHILDGRIAHVLLLELFTDHGAGTMITGDVS
ncbi:MAG: acetylglutamate kinase [Actinobacteria bacterium]|uniref:acetylglutamate kinase n=1 Tax=freshwater metagenome TaxID=449393 RepID=A0A6J6DZW4_9ZZZZ|nr:acetylglutamate kinase [Actinomycetota bacterium]